jgi:hypothetical protein
MLQDDVRDGRSQLLRTVSEFRLGVRVMIASDIRDGAGEIEKIGFECLREGLIGQPDAVRR